jgi:hypothetical protein
MEAPLYIPIEEINIVKPEHKWNDWDPFEMINWPDENFKKNLAKVSNNGITCFALGCAEWVVYRLGKYLKENLAFHYLEAFWLYIMGIDAALPPETDNENWQGVILGPINLALMTVLNTIYLAEQGPPVQNGALAAEIAKHVLNDTEKFDKWRDDVIHRLIKYSSRIEEYPEGRPLPCEILNPKYEYDEDKRMNLIKKSVYSIDFKINPFLLNIDKEKLQINEFF